MPTLRGWLVAVSGLAVWLAGRLLGSSSVEQLGFGLIAIVTIATGVLRLGRHDLRVSASVSPREIPVGKTLTVSLDLDNLGEGSLPAAQLEMMMPTELGGRARFVLEAMRPGAQADFAFDARARRRGAWEVGPLRVSLRDPFGLASMSRSIQTPSRVMVLPRVHPLGVPPSSHERRTVARTTRRQLTSAQGEDFYTLREYVEGDDLRRISWSATAKRNRFMIKQEETPWQARATVILDDRASQHDRASWERAVEAAASAVDVFAKSGYTVTLAPGAGQILGPGKGESFARRCSTFLATLETSRNASEVEAEEPLMKTLAAPAAAAGSLDVLVVICGRPEGSVVEMLGRIAPRCRALLLVKTGPATLDVARMAGVGIKLVAFEDPHGLVQAWDLAWNRSLTTEGGEPSSVSSSAPA